MRPEAGPLLTDRASQVTRWVTFSILAQDDLKKRANVIKHFVDVAEVRLLVSSPLNRD